MFWRVSKTGIPIAYQATDWFKLMGGARIPTPDWLIKRREAQQLNGTPYRNSADISFGLVYNVMGYTSYRASVYAPGECRLQPD
jgi:hypothetical protein